MKTRFSTVKGCVFPREVGTERVVTEGMMATAKPYAIRILTANGERVQRHFKRYATRKYRCKPSSVKFEMDRSVKRIRAAVLSDLSDDVYGETDGDTIWINSGLPMTWGDIVATLVHESLHDCCFVRGKTMSCLGEHRCMQGLGEVCAD